MQCPLCDTDDFPPNVRSVLRLCAAASAQVRSGKADGLVVLTFLDGKPVDVFDAGNVPPYAAVDACRRVAQRFSWD